MQLYRFLFITEFDNYILQLLVIVKVNRVFSSYIIRLASAPKIQFHKSRKYDSKTVVTIFMLDYIY